ncbi:uncharacterized protein [Temnothorax longispinosus]|uniref:uncharacterized protein n=1 Tax=Temnothorax longispinosus TaxID=300112 RepID=UPI003A99215B
MPSRCTALRCSNNSDDGYTLVTYPRDELLKKQWIVAVGRGKNWSPTKSQKLCEVHFEPSEIIFVAGRKCVKPGAVPSRFCTCPSGDQANCPRKIKKSQQGITKKTKNVTENHCDHAYATSDQQKPLSVNIKSSGQTCLKRKLKILAQHQCGCVQTCKPLTKEDVQTTAESQEIVEQMDEMRPMDESEDLLRSIIEEDKRLRNEMKGIVEEVYNYNHSLILT